MTQPIARRNRRMKVIAARQLQAAAPHVDRVASAYQMLIATGWNDYFRRRHRWLLLSNDAALVVQACEHTRAWFEQAVRDNAADTDDGRLARLILKHYADEAMLMAIGCAFAIEHVRRGGRHA